MSKRLKIAFSDFWGDFNPYENFFFNVLKLKYELEFSDTPDVLIFSTFGENHLRYKCKKIHFTGEPRKAPPETYDYAFGFAADEKTYRLPLWVLYINWFNRAYPIHPACTKSSPEFLIPLDALFRQRISTAKEFCSFVYNNPGGPRLSMLALLRGYKNVNCGGNLENNIGGPLRGDERTKLNFLRQRRFSIAFESCRQKGYVTEKLLHALMAPSIPIYWGAEEAQTDFNPAAFIDARHFASLDDMADYVRMVDARPDLYQRYIEEPVFKSFALPHHQFCPAVVAQKLMEVIG